MLTFILMMINVITASSSQRATEIDENPGSSMSCFILSKRKEAECHPCVGFKVPSSEVRLEGRGYNFPLPSLRFLFIDDMICLCYFNLVSNFFHLVQFCI